MSLVVAVLLAALVLGWLAGGSLDRLGDVGLRSRRLVVAALLIQLVGVVVGGPFYPAGLVLSLGLVSWFLAKNRGIRGTGLVALGLLANAVVVAANGAMPVSEAAVARAGVSTQDLLTGADTRHLLAGEATRLPWLADVIPVALPLRPEVVSPGDVLVAAGLAQLVLLGMLRTPRLRRALPPVPADRSRRSAGPPALPPGLARPPDPDVQP